MSTRKGQKASSGVEEESPPERPTQLMWVEKYRPMHLKDIFDQVQIVARLEALVKKPNEMPHLLFAGPPGTGKTTTAVCLASEIMGEGWKDYTLELNASNERGIDTVRERIKNFASYSDRREGIPFRIVLLDESDAMCLDPNTKVIAGRIEDELCSTSLDELLIQNGDSTFDIPSLSSESFRVENDRGRIIPSGRVDLLEIEFEDGRTIRASADHPFFSIEDGNLKVLKAREIVSGKTEFVDCSSVFSRCFSCRGLFFRDHGQEVKDKFYCRECSQTTLKEFNMQAESRPRQEEVIRIALSGRSMTSGDCKINSLAELSSLIEKRENLGIDSRGAIEHSGIKSVKKLSNGPFEVLNISVEKNKNFILANGILTHNTSDAQTALRRIMEESSRTTRFILTANYSSNIIEPIQSRCAIFKFSRLPKADVIRYLEDICKKEKVKYEKESLEKIYEATEGDMRHALNMLQAASTLGDISSESVDKVTGLSKKSKVAEILDLAFKGDFAEARKQTIELLQVGGMSEHDFIKFANEALIRSDYSSSIEAIQATAETDFRLLQGSNPDIQISSYLATLSKIGSESNSGKGKKKD